METIKVGNYSFPIISNKSVRQNENFKKVFKHKKGGILTQTNRGYFLNGKNISGFSAAEWLSVFGLVDRNTGGWRPFSIYRKRTSPVFSQKAKWQEDRKAAAKKRHDQRTLDYHIKYGFGLSDQILKNSILS